MRFLPTFGSIPKCGFCKNLHFKCTECNLPYTDEEGFEKICDFLRDAASDMDDTGKGNEDADCTTLVMSHFRSATIPNQARGRGTHAGHERGRGKSYPQS